MSEKECRDQAITILKGLTTYFPVGAESGAQAVNTGRYSILDTGVTYAAIFHPARFSSSQTSAYQSPKHWHIIVDLFYKPTDDEQTNWDNFSIFREAIIAELDSHNTLGGHLNVTAVTISADNDPLEITRREKDGTALDSFIWEALRIDVEQLVPITDKETP
jgi:hypothetical protein